MSKRIGDSTVVIRTEGDNEGVSVGGDSKNPPTRTSGKSSNTSEVARRLYKPEEILTLPPQTAIVFHKNNYVIACDKIKYYADRAFRRRGIFRKRWGTGRTRGLGLSGMAMGVVALVSALAVTWLVMQIPARRPAAASASGRSAGTPLPYQWVPGSRR